MRKQRRGEARHRWLRSWQLTPPPMVCLRPTDRSAVRRRRMDRRIAAARRMVRTCDAVLRRLYGVFEFTSHRRCVLRIALRHTTTSFCLDDGALIPEGARFADLHFWNEQLIPLPQSGPSFAWVQCLQRQIAISLAELAAYVETNPGMRDVVAFRARVAFANPGRQQKMRRIADRFGFMRLRAPPPTPLGRRIHDFFDDYWLVGLVWTFNPRALRRRAIVRLREDFWISRSALVERYRTRT